MLRTRLLILATVSLTCGSGCARFEPYPQFNQYGGPGFLSGSGFFPREQALREAEIQRFDPYPDNDIGPPMVGVRPPDFSAPINETARGRWIGGGASFPRRALGL